MTTPAEQRLEAVEKKLRAAIREAIAGGHLFTADTQKLNDQYAECGGVEYYDELYEQELAAIAAEVKS